jgi:divalent metal cation (Fe/Co/Zn/Cd) transporter
VARPTLTISTAMKVAKERKSAVLHSNAVHHRVDSLTGIAALVAIAVSNVFPTFVGVDALGGLIISWMVIKAGWGNTWTSLSELADASISEKTKIRVRRASSQALQESALDFVDVRNVQGIKAGQNYLLEVEVAVPGNRKLEDLCHIEDVIRERVGAKVRGARRVRVKFLAVDSDRGDFVDEFISPSVSARSSPEPEEEHDHHDEQSGLREKKQK